MVIASLLLPTAYRFAAGAADPGLIDGQRAPVRMEWKPDENRYEGTVRANAGGAQTALRFDAHVVSESRMEGEMIATIRVNGGGNRDRCTAARGLIFERQGR